MEGYDFASATQRLYALWQYELCDVYIELMKPIMAMDDSTPQQVGGGGGPWARTCVPCTAHALRCARARVARALATPALRVLRRRSRCGHPHARPAAPAGADQEGHARRAVDRAGVGPAPVAPLHAVCVGGAVAAPAAAAGAGPRVCAAVRARGGESCCWRQCPMSGATLLLLLLLLLAPPTAALLRGCVQGVCMAPSIMLAPYPAGVPAWDNAQLEAEYDYLMDCVTKVLDGRAQGAAHSMLGGRWCSCSRSVFCSPRATTVPPRLQIRKLRNDYGLLKQKPHLFFTATDASKAAVLERSQLDVSARGGVRAAPVTCPPEHHHHHQPARPQCICSCSCTHACAHAQATPAHPAHVRTPLPGRSCARSPAAAAWRCAGWGARPPRRPWAAAWRSWMRPPWRTCCSRASWTRPWRWRSCGRRCGGVCCAGRGVHGASRRVLIGAVGAAWRTR